jgi:ribonuclease P protein component
MAECHPPSHRLRKRQDIEETFQQGRLFKGRLLRMRAVRMVSEGAVSKLGIVVSKRVNKLATQRNLWKRRIREAYRVMQQEKSGAFKILIHATPQAKTPPFEEIQKDLRRLFQEAKIV